MQLNDTASASAAPAPVEQLWPATRYPSLGGAVWLVILLFVAMVAGSFTVQFLGLQELPAVRLLGEMVIPTAAVAWHGWRRRPISVHALVVLPRPLLPLVGALGLTLLGFWILLFQSFAWLTSLLPIPQMLLDLMENRVSGPWLPIIVVLLLAAYVEEVLFRGIILEGLLERYSAVTAVFLSALVFSLVHVVPWSIFASFAGGVLLGWIYYRTRSLVLCAAVHAVHNLGFHHVIVGLAGLAGLEEFRMGQPIERLLPPWLVLLGVAFVAAGILVCDGELRKSRAGAA